MPADYLLKTEPSEYSFADLQKDKQTVWEGVTNPTAVMHMRAMKAGDRVIIYETGSVRSAIGTGTIISADPSDPKKPIVEIKAGQCISKPVSLHDIKRNKLFANSPLVKIGRLSVVPLNSAQYKAIVGE
jgi:predicted RNA-binding protein with PUA-like domain